MTSSVLSQVGKPSSYARRQSIFSSFLTSIPDSTTILQLMAERKYLHSKNNYF